MNLKIIGTESLGVRGMCCLVAAGERRILIDPGIALGYQRHALLPHPCQIKTGMTIRREIIKAIEGATDIVFSHFHGDHIPLLKANPYQLSFKQFPDHPQRLRIWAKAKEDLAPHLQQRALDLEKFLGSNIKTAEGCQDGPLTFSGPVPHGLPGERFGSVMMTRIDTGTEIFVHTADIQLLDREAVDRILQWQPDVVFTDGPPLYLGSLSGAQRKTAWENGLRLASGVGTLIVDHHLLRSQAGISWLDNMSQVAGKKIYCAADFMNKPRVLLEARRRELYREAPIAKGWHDEYEAGKIRVDQIVGQPSTPLSKISLSSTGKK